MSGTIPVAVEFGVVAIGPIANLVAFVIMVVFSVLFYQVPSRYPFRFDFSCVVWWLSPG